MQRNSGSNSENQANQPHHIVRNLWFIVFACALCCCFSIRSAWAQSSTAATVLGTVTDNSGAVLRNAELKLVNDATGNTLTQTSNDAGQYAFTAVPPGSYHLSVTMAGFKSLTVPNIVTSVNKSFTINPRLLVGAVSEVMEVTATNAVELQTTDAQVGDVINEESIVRLPTLQRNAAELLALQPGVSPGAGANAFPNGGIRVAGALDDQNTITLDGIDISDNLIGGAGATNNGAALPIPADSVQEFRVAVTNANATLNRASGGQVTLVGRTGTNSFHGSTYWFHQNDNLNANSWENGRTGVKKAELKDNRYGVRFGGPILKNKTFFFGMYEGRRFPNSVNVTRIVPSNSLKAGILRFRDASGNVVSYNLATAAFCGTDATTGARLNLVCDPRGLGIDPAVKQLWDQTPAGNDTSGTDTSSGSSADGLNTLAFRGTASAPVKDDYYVLRLDHNLTSKWTFNGSYTYSRDKQTDNNQFDFRNGNVKAVAQLPTYADAIIGSLTGQITTNLLNVFRFGYVRNRSVLNRLTPSATAGIEQLTGSQGGPTGFIAIEPGLGPNASNGFAVESPIDADTQRARYQLTTSKNIQFVDDVTWVKGKHQIQGGVNFRRIPTLHIRNDKVVGSLTSMQAVLDAKPGGSFITLSPNDAPPACGPGISTNCLLPTDEQQWNRLYAATLGLVDSVSILGIRDANLQPTPLGTNLANDALLKAYNFYAQDTWRLRPSLTFTYGLGYGWQTPPKEKLGRQTAIIDPNNNNSFVSIPDYLAKKQAAALNGQIYNPSFGFIPVNQSHRSLLSTDWSNWAPRVSLAWSPSYTNGFMGRIMGDTKTVIRGGFGIAYDRMNTVETVLIPMLGVGFGQTITVPAPLCGVSGTGGPGCGTDATDPGSSAFRVGVDGALPTPQLTPATSPIIPTSDLTEVLSIGQDPDTKVGRSYNVDFSIQREMRWGMMLEVDYLGHFGRNLPNSAGFGAAPYMFKDPKSGQSFAQAFDLIATALRNGASPTSIPNQPWFEDQLPGIAPILTPKTPTLSATQAVIAAAGSSSFVGGDVSNIFTAMSFGLEAMGKPGYVNLQAVIPEQRTFFGVSNYNAMVVSLRKRTAHGLTFDANYTFAKALDENVTNQNNAGFYSNAFHPGVDYGPSLFDRTHVFTANAVWDLPFGKGHRFSTGNWIDRAVGGWYVSTIFNAYTGLPLNVTESSQVWGGGLALVSNTSEIKTGSVSTGIHKGVAGSGGFGTAGDPASGGTGLNLFADPAAVATNDFRPILISSDKRSGAGNPIRGLGFWNTDMELGKSTSITERVKVSYSADFFNIFNHVNLADPSTDLTNPNTFGVINQQFVPTNRTSGSRWIQMGIRVEF